MTEPQTWCTNWDAYDVPRLWDMVSTEDSREAWAQVSAWFRLRDAVDEQRVRLAACRQALVDTWPPERSEASAAFVAVFDELVASMTDTVRAAASTATGLAGVLESLATAKAEIKPLYDEWLAKSNDLTPHWLDHAEDGLNEKARDAMVKAEKAVAEYIPMIQPPPQYELDIRRDPEVLVELDKRSTTTSWSGSLGPAPAVPHKPPLPLPGMDPVVVPGTPDTPVLSGAPVPTPPAVVPSQMSVAPVPPGIVPGPSGVPVPVPTAWLVPTPRGHALAPGGVIGPTLPPAPTGTPARGTPSGPAAVRGAVPGLVAPSAMPSTGAVAARPAAAAGADRSGHAPRHSVPPAGNGYRTPDGHVVTVSGLGVRHGDTPQRPPADPYDPWGVDEGVPSVVAPDLPGRHDPGPGVIGMDR